MSTVLHAARNAYLTMIGRSSPQQTMRGHNDTVTGAAFFKDGQRVVTSSSDHTSRIWDVQKGTLVAGPFKGHSGMIQSVALSPNDILFATGGGGDYTIIIWDVESNQKIFDPLVKHTAWVRSVCFSPDGKRLASGSDDRTVVIWDVETGEVLATLQGHHYWVCSVAFSADGLKLASGSSDRTIRVWRTDNAELLLKINAHKDMIRSVVWSPDGQQLVSASEDQTVKFWDSSTGQQVGRHCTGHTDSVNSIAISNDESFIATASRDKTVRLWNTKTRRQVGRPLEHSDIVVCVAISSNGELLVSGGVDGNVYLWSIKNMIEPHKVKESLKDNEEAEESSPTPDMQDFSCSVTLSRSYDTNEELSCDHDGTHNNSSDTHELIDSRDKFSLFDICTVTTTVLNACIAGDLHIAEELLTEEIDIDTTNYNSYANRSVVRARNGEWDHAVQDAVQSIAIQPSLMGYISKGIALCGKEQLWDAMEAFDLGFVFSNRDPMTINLLLLIKAIVLFNASHRDEALRRVQDLAIACQDIDTLPCAVVDLYLCMQYAILAFNNGQYSEAADRLKGSIASTMSLMSQETLLEPRFKMFTVLFGWDLGSLWQTTNLQLCDALLHADRVIDAIESYQCMLGKIYDAVNSCPDWSTTFKQDCTIRCVAKGEEAVAVSDYEGAIKLYSAAISLDSSCRILFVCRSNAKLGQHHYLDALADAEQVVKIDPLSYIGYELRYAALLGAQRYDEAIEAFKHVLLKLDDTADVRKHDLRQQYVSPSEVDDVIQMAVRSLLDNTPHRLINTSTGHLCDREEQIYAFKVSTEYKKLLASTITHAHLGSELIQDVISIYFRCVMLSHRWEGREPLLRDIQGKVVYELNSVGSMGKLQSFCKIARDAGYYWAWIDTCCIDQSNNVEVQESVNSMFIWYRHSALTIVYLSDVPPSSKPGALAESVWNTRGWTVQEFLAPRFVLFYQQDWTLYLNDRSSNHKESVRIMQELADATGINVQTLVHFHPGMRDARKKLQWVSRRITTRQEDIAYSLFGIFGINLPVIYGEKKQNALGRLLQEIVAQSGDITALDWVGQSSVFNSCIPADISSYKSLSCTFPSLSDDETQASVSSLRNVVTVELASRLYTLLDNLSASRFTNRRLHLHCIVFSVTEVVMKRGAHLTYEIKVQGLQDLTITTEDKLIQFSLMRPTPQAFLLVRPWNRHDLGLPDFADDTESVKDWAESGSPSNYQPGESHSRALRLIVRLGQPFSALLLAQQRGEEYKRIASDHEIIAQLKEMTSVHNMMNVRTLEIL
ncbi:hypothetical protein K503DRAFT_709950 [Rhizopogon vinicolor AM-OR11-026]|uniref:Uncharacterized protein n=1 Tax=Rhizopogon vinicolor AM-OR11-026 TaxID=1314800 RepID=A0A1B7ND30_9AGAM|nr:hypothetical protein K503DRAFT_709950 [Rhizopogon vinicolor AM-OR11-026]